MNNQGKKCSSNKHSNIDAISYCQECKKFFCNKCQNFHSELFENHIIYNLDKELGEIFTNICNEKNHHIKLEFYCKTHNILCCSSCICKIKNEIYGKHRDCDIYIIKDIIEEKKNKLKENINILEELSNNIDKTIEELKILYEKISKNKEELKTKIQQIFTKIRSSLNEKEDKLLLEVDEKYNNSFFKEELIKEIEKLPNKIKISLNKGKMIEKEYKESIPNSFVNECINIENNIEKINKIKNNMKKYDSNEKLEIIYNLEENEINNLLNNIKNLGQITTKSDNEYLYKDFNIETKNPIYELNSHTGNVLCLTILYDGRLVSGARDCLIIIYNKTTYQPDLKIKEHNDIILCICQLSTGILASCSKDKTIKLFKIKGFKYEILQSINFHKDTVYKIIELKDKRLVSCSSDSSIIFYYEENLKYIKDYQISTNGSCSSMIQIKDEEICYSEQYNDAICFFDLIKRKIKSSISKISKRNSTDEWFIMISENLLAIPGESKITIIDVVQHEIKRIINVEDSSWLFGSCMLRKNMLITGGRDYSIRQWKIEGDNLVLISKREKAHNGDINFLLNLGNGHIASGSDGGTIKIW